MMNELSKASELVIMMRMAQLISILDLGSFWGVMVVLGSPKDKHCLFLLFVELASASDSDDGSGYIVVQGGDTDTMKEE